MFKDFKLFSVFFVNISLKISPSSTYKLFLITLSRVMLFPKIFILSTVNFSDSLILKVKLILFVSITSSTVAVVDSNCSSKTISSISSIILFTELSEYGSPFNFLNKLFIFSKFL